MGEGYPHAPSDAALPPAASPPEAALSALGAALRDLSHCAAALRAPHRSLYQHALADGVEELLAGFQADACTVEDEAAADASLTPAHVWWRLRDHAAVLPAVCSVVRPATDADTRGGRLLDALHARCADGEPGVGAAFRALLAAAHRPFYAHLTQVRGRRGGL